MAEEKREAGTRVLDIILGPHCPFCNCRAHLIFHSKCPAMRDKTPQQVVERVSVEIRRILKDEPADRFVHEAYEAVEHLEKEFGGQR